MIANDRIIAIFYVELGVNMYDFHLWLAMDRKLILRRVPLGGEGRILAVFCPDVHYTVSDLNILIRPQGGTTYVGWWGCAEGPMDIRPKSSGRC